MPSVCAPVDLSRAIRRHEDRLAWARLGRMWARTEKSRSNWERIIAFHTLRIAQLRARQEGEKNHARMAPRA